MDFCINVKVNFRGNSRNFLLSGSETKSWDSMEAMVKRSFSLCSLQLTYFDEENEEVSINSQVEYEEALKTGLATVPILSPSSPRPCRPQFSTTVSPEMSSFIETPI